MWAGKRIRRKVRESEIELWKSKNKLFTSWGPGGRKWCWAVFFLLFFYSSWLHGPYEKDGRLHWGFLLDDGDGVGPVLALGWIFHGKEVRRLSFYCNGAPAHSLAIFAPPLFILILCTSMNDFSSLLRVKQICRKRFFSRQGIANNFQSLFSVECLHRVACCFYHSPCPMGREFSWFNLFHKLWNCWNSHEGIRKITLFCGKKYIEQLHGASTSRAKKKN